MSALGCLKFESDFVTRNHVIYALADRVARSAIARSGVQRETGRAAAQYLFSKDWILDLRGGFATGCSGHEAANVIYAKTSSMPSSVIYGGDVMYGFARRRSSGTWSLYAVIYARKRHLCAT